MASITIDKIHKSYDGTDALKGVSLSICDGEFMTLVGPSGCGKSTLLRTIAGLEPQTAGNVLIDNTNVSAARPSERNLAMVFQSYALYPHLTVFDNIAVPLRMRHHSRLQRMPLLRWFVPGTRDNEARIRKQIVSTAQSLGLSDLLHRKPGQLSGGQRQRVAVGRAIVREPEAFLLDEPLSNLDAKMRVHMRTEITQLHRSLAATFVYVTHDQAEAMTMSDRIAVMMDGEIIQTGTPDEIYQRPVDIRVAEFIGSPKINILPARVDSSGSRSGSSSHSIGNVEVLGKTTSLRVPVSSSLRTIGVRPEACTLIQPVSDGNSALSADAANLDRSIPGDSIPNDSIRGGSLQNGSIQSESIQNDQMLTGLILTGVVTHVENFGAEVFVHIQVPGLDDNLIIRGEPSLLASARMAESVTVRLNLEKALAFDSNGQSIDCQLSDQADQLDTVG